MCVCVCVCVFLLGRRERDGEGGMSGRGAAAAGAGSSSSHSSPQEVIESLKHLYMDKILPVEKQYLFGEFHSPLLTPSDFDAKPMVLLLGQYSVGKVRW